ncbi:13340_t:CDS:2 [Cetraspora pellucida]|uniref:13340_t:CDS:1 n=1 Tax=Cetraspora pellucida TaxID=1433469 RepID=A0A9N9JZQ5_9GLOM|nr:13340_t:CDS:2 [Cetraspora pellucida]
MERCWNSDLNQRPTANELGDIIINWSTSHMEQFQNAVIMFWKTQLISKPRKMDHPKAYYTSRLLNPFALNNLREYERRKTTEINVNCDETFISENMESLALTSNEVRMLKEYDLEPRDDGY